MNKATDYGLFERDINYIIQAIKTFPEIEKAVIFGSRAMSNYKIGSDIDLAIWGKKVNSKTINKLSFILNEELPLPYFIDVLNYNTLANEDLQKYINIEGKILYNKQSSNILHN